MNLSAPWLAHRPRLWTCNSCQLELSHRRLAKRWFSVSTKYTSTELKPRRLPDSPARTRFAPSPTGYLHLGSLRTALFNYLLAKRTKGQFLLRIEDTDQKRTIPGAEERLYQDLAWTGIHWDEGPDRGGPYGPYRQSQRLKLYHSHVQTLLDNGKAYRCFCSAERLDELNRFRYEKGQQPGYDRKCVDLSKEEAEARASQGQPHVVRFLGLEQYPKFTDLVFGKTGSGKSMSKAERLGKLVYDDPVLLKSDGFPTYHLANVVDDRLMQITHVIRGSEWISSTPLHVALYEAFGWEPPQFGHVPLLVDQNRQKLSKRNFDTGIDTFRDKGILPVSLVNFAALLGWSHQQSSDVMDLSELENVFDLKFTKGNAMVSFIKLDYLQAHHTRRYMEQGSEEYEQIIRDVAVALLDRYGARAASRLIGKRKLRDVIATILSAKSFRYHSAPETVNQLSIYLDESLIKNRQPFEASDSSLLRNIRVAASTLTLIPEEQWNSDVIRTHFSQLVMASPSEEDPKVKKQSMQQLYEFLRWALIGGANGPSMPEIMETLGRDISVQRIRDAALTLKEMEIRHSKPKLRDSLQSTNQKPQGANDVNSKQWEEHTLPSEIPSRTSAAVSQD